MADDDLVLRLTGDATSLHTVLDRARKDVAKTAKDMLSSATKAEREAAAVKQKGAQVTAALLTPTERYRKELSSLNKLLKQSAIEQTTYNRALAQIRQQLPSVQKAQESHNRALRMAAQITEAMRTPAEDHNRHVLQLNNLLNAGHISQETYNRALEESRKSLPSVAAATKAAEEAQRELNAIMERGKHVTASSATAIEHYRAKRAELDNLLKAGAITVQTYDRALRAEKDTLPSVIAATRAAKEAQKELDDQMARGRQLTDSVLPPTIRYQRAHAELSQLLKVGAIDMRLYLQLLALESAKLPEVAKAQKLYDDQIERGKQIYLQMLTPLQHYIRENRELKAMLSAGAITQKEYNFALEQARSKHLGIKTAMERHNDAIARGKALTEQLIPPSQRYQLRLKELNGLYKSGYIHQRTYLRGVRQLRMEFNNISPALQKASSGLRQFGGSMRMGGYLASAFVTAPLVALATTGVHSLIEFDKAMTYSLSIAENVTPKLRKEMEQTAITLSEKTAHSAIELAQAYYELISAGMSAEASMKSLATVSKFAIAGDMNLASSVKQLAKATAAMGLAGRNAEETAQGMKRVANVLVQAANLTTGSIEDMTQALVNAAAPQARLLNMQIEETTAVLMHYIQVGESAATASEHFAIGMRLLGQAADKQKDFWKQQKLELYTATGQMRKFTDVLRDMQKIYLSLTPQGRVPFLKSLGFEALQQRALNPLLADPHAAEQIDEWTEKLKDMEALNRVFEEQMKSLSNQFKVFRNMLQNVGMEIGTILMPYLNKFIAGAKLLIAYWKQLTPETKKVAVVIGAVAAAIGPALIAMGTLATIAAVVAGALAGIVSAVISIGAPILAAVAAIGLLVSGFVLLVGGAVAYEYALKKWPEGTRKTLHILERMFHAFQGFMEGVFEKVFTVDTLKYATTGFAAIVPIAAKFGKLIGDALSGKDVTNESDKLSDHLASMIQAAFDKAAGKQNLGKALNDILKQELGVDLSFDGLKKKLDEVKKKIDETVGAETNKQQFEMMATEADKAAKSFSSLADEIRNTGKQFEEQIALEEEQARRGYDKVEQMTSAERELMKIELKNAKQRKDFIEKYDEEMKVKMELTARSDQLTIKGAEAALKQMQEMERARTEAISNLDEQTESEMRSVREQAEKLSILQKQKQLEDMAKRYESPMQKFTRETKDLQKVFNAGKISTTQFAKEMRKLRNEMVKEINIDFRISGVEGVEAGTAEASAALENFLAMQSQSKRPIDLETGKFRDVAAKGTSVTKTGRSASVRVPINRRQQRAQELVDREKRNLERDIGRSREAKALREQQARDAQTNREAVGALSPDELASAQQEAMKFFGNQAEDSGMDREATSAGDTAQTTNKMDILREPLERVARATEKMARTKPIELKPANL